MCHQKGPLKLILQKCVSNCARNYKFCPPGQLQRTCKAGEIAHSFLVCVKSVTFYNFKLAYVVLHMAVKEFFETHF